jgi:signal transduction histidine kinase
VAAALIAAAAFAPARKRIQAFVDKAFFRRSHDYRRAVSGFATAAQSALGKDELAGLLQNALDQALPVEKVGVLSFEAGSGPPPAVAWRHGLDEGAVLPMSENPDGPPVIRAAEGSVEQGVKGVDAGRSGLPASIGYEIAVPLAADGDSVAGWILVGRKRSGEKFTAEDLELLETLAAELALALGRIRLQEEVIYERASREKSEELSRLKTEFISSVSHELRTPMTSLQGLSQLLQSGKVRGKERRDQLLELMAGECGRLARFLNNVLDFGRIEQGAKSYKLRKTDLRPLVVETADLVRSAMGEEPVELVVEVPDGPAVVDADPDAVRQALLNLLDNAVKYSVPPKRVVLRLAAGPEGTVDLGVEDNGIGIPAEDIERIFEAFFRSPEAVRHDPKGVGLGLKIVKHVMDAHGGTVEARSEPGRGSAFTLRFPKERGA